MKYDIKNRTINVWLPKNLFKMLKEKIKARNEKNTKPILKLAQASYLLNLVIYIPSTKKDEYEDGWVPICSKIFNLYNFSKYIDFLVEEKLLISNKNNYSNNGNLNRKGKNYCKSFRLPDPFYKHKVKSIPVIGNKNFIETRMAKMKENMEAAHESTGHLTKWLNLERFQIDTEAAKSLIKSKYPDNKDNNKHNHRIMSIETIDQGGWGYSRDGKDNRLHSALTSLPKDLRQFVTYDGSPLVSLDIKNSQPYIFSSLLNNLRSNNKENHIQTMLNKHRLILNMFYGFYGPSNNGDLERFIELVENGTIYDKYYDTLFNAELVFQNCCGTFSYEEQTDSGNRTKKFDSKRDLGKDIMMKTLFSSLNNTQRIIKIFEGEFPTVYNIMQKIKGMEPKEKNFFPVLLQNIEADCILDHCTKLIALEHPDMPLFTIHDSIVTTEENLGILREGFERHLKSYFGNIPELKTEPWATEEEDNDLLYDFENIKKVSA